MDTENALRDFTQVLLQAKFGEEWIIHLGITEDRVNQWKSRMEEERKSQRAGAVEEHLLYYADFYDLQKIIEKNWEQLFKDVFFDLKALQTYFDKLQDFRDQDAHRRELLLFQQNLVMGICGEILSLLVKYRSNMGGHFPQIESAQDSLGSLLLPGPIVQFTLTKKVLRLVPVVLTEKVLRPGDEVEFVITASDMEGGEIEFAMGKDFCGGKWQKDNHFKWRIDDSDIGKKTDLTFYIRSMRKHHAMGDYDDFVNFSYNLIPKR
ncbi:MAG: Swt1 family HEPN domain-containing protein [Methanocellales archaeon]|nr:Swt1 family HEPN domain-containing protein [Methanocellales archaeon]MDD5446426.1 Swt1 family HEPN domain-containing protein [Methanocellales archaeon]